MNIRLKLFLSILIVFTLAALIPEPVQAGDKPVLYGKVFLQTSSGFKKPLAKARIQLLEVTKGQKPGEVLFKTYTSSRGSFAFYKIPSRRYYVKVVYNKEVFLQLQGEKRVEVSSVNVNAPHKTTQLPDIIVSRQ